MTGNHQTKTTQWFRALYSLLAVLMLLALAAFGFATWKDVKRQALESLTPHNQTFNQVVGRFFSHQDAMLANLAQSITLTQNSDLSQRQQLTSRLQDVMMATAQMKVLAIIDRRGHVLASTQDSEVIDWKARFAVDQTIIGQPFRTSFLSETLLPMRHEIHDGTGQKTGYLVAAYRLLGKNAIWQAVGDEEKGARRSMVIDDTGRVYLSYPESDSFWQTVLSSRVEADFLTALQGSATGNGAIAGDEVAFQNEELVFIGSYLERYRLFTVSALAQSELITRWLVRMRYVTLAVLLFLVCGLVVFRLILRRATWFESARNAAQSYAFKLSKAIDQSPSSVIVTDSNWQIEYANNRLSQSEKHSTPIQPGNNLLLTFPHQLLAEEEPAIVSHLKHSSSWYAERRAKEPDQWYSFSISSMNTGRGEKDSYVIITQNITERKQAEVRLFRQANFDALTGLPNRRRTHDLLADALQKACRQSQKVAVLYMDVDNFKQINDTYGHLLGDQLLQLIAVRLRDVAGQEAVACHMSGDEFLLFMPFTHQQMIIDMAQAIMDAMKPAVQLESKRLFISVSVGIACYPYDSDNVTSMLKNADIALYESKSRGRRCFSFFTQELDQKNKRKVAVESEIRHALDRNELSMVYQIKNHIDTGQVFGFEALMRWNNTHIGPVSPDEFIGAAEEIGVIDAIGEFALRQACKDLTYLQAILDYPITMAVNVSMEQLTNSDIVTTVGNVLADTCTDPASLELEITETLLAQSIEQVQPILNNLLALGVSLSIDDFGTGYSSLSYLTRFPVSTLKIDRCFVTNMVENVNDATLTQTVITMAHKLGLKVVAEGIENRQQLDLLKSYACDIGQGYLFTRPLPLEEMRAYLAALQPPDWVMDDE